MIENTLRRSPMNYVPIIISSEYYSGKNKLPGDFIRYATRMPRYKHCILMIHRPARIDLNIFFCRVLSPIMLYSTVLLSEILTIHSVTQSACGHAVMF